MVALAAEHPDKRQASQKLPKAIQRRYVFHQDQITDSQPWGVAPLMPILPPLSDLFPDLTWNTHAIQGVSSEWNYIFHEYYEPLMPNSVVIAPLQVAPLANSRRTVKLTYQEMNRLLPDFKSGRRIAPLRECLHIKTDSRYYTVTLTDMSPLRHARNEVITCPQFDGSTVVGLKNVIQRANWWLLQKGFPTIDTHARQHHLILNAGLLVLFMEHAIKGHIFANGTVAWSDGGGDDSDHLEPRHKTYIALRLAQLFSKDPNGIAVLDNVIDGVVGQIEYYLNLGSDDSINQTQ